jgi:hypothetical protein
MLRAVARGCCPRGGQWLAKAYTHLVRTCLVALLVAAGCAAPRPPCDRIAERFKYRVEFDRGKRVATATDSVDVIELWGTRPGIEIGGEYVVVGRYTLGSADEGTVFFYMTANDWDNSGYVMDLQQIDVRRGTGTFVLRNEMAGPGWFHVNLYGDGKEVADLYFGKGDTLLEAGPAVRAR